MMNQVKMSISASVHVIPRCIVNSWMARTYLACWILDFTVKKSESRAEIREEKFDKRKEIKQVPGQDLKLV